MLKRIYINLIGLLDVPYSTEVGYMLVSVGRLDEAGFTDFGGRKCMLKREDDVVVGVML